MAHCLIGRPYPDLELRFFTNDLTQHLHEKPTAQNVNLLEVALSHVFKGCTKQKVLTHAYKYPMSPGLNFCYFRGYF